MVFGLDERLLFPDPALADEDGLLAVGGDLSVDRLLLAYRNGIFPWYSDNTPVLWFSPHERFVLFPQELKVSKSMQKVLRSGVFHVTRNRCFDRVITECAKAPRAGQDGTWITADMIAAYIELYRRGWAHSIEVWFEGELAGGLYGVKAGDVFCGESMFSKVSNASKTALVYLCRQDYRLIDCQVHTDHLASMGARMISRKEYMEILKNQPG